MIRAAWWLELVRERLGERSDSMGVGSGVEGAVAGGAAAVAEQDVGSRAKLKCTYVDHGSEPGGSCSNEVRISVV